MTASDSDNVWPVRATRTLAFILFSLFYASSPSFGAISCTAKDVKGITVSNFTVTEACSGPSDTGTAKFDLGFDFTGGSKYDFVLAIMDAADTVGDGTLDSSECLGQMATGNASPFADTDGDGDCYDLGAGTYSFSNISAPFQCPVNGSGGLETSFTPRVVFGWNGDGGFNVSCAEPSTTSTAAATKITLSKTTTDTSSTGTATGSFAFTTTNTDTASPSLTTTAASTPVSTDLWVTGTVSGGAYTADVAITETLDSAWDLTAIACTDGSGSAVGTYDLATGLVTLPASSLTLGSTLSCAFTNNAASAASATLTLNKVVVGGTAVAGDFTLTATGPATLSGTSGISGTVPTGTYTLSETSVTDYSSAVACSGAADTNLTDGLTLADTETVTCTFTNTYSPATANFTVSKSQTGGSNPVTAPGAISWTITVENTGSVALTSP
uniref:prealbumin-like fold domain-containing protein n=1 Tax=Actibacterium sp. TaxID=1872125 RepID=UPI00356AC8C1